ncbi:hypothetical protein [Mycobacterium kansasii]|uniref:hypothetical protein n=1 Tax=Mycobacterium kansasii TaxID=1768 RepID=UPI0015E439D0|nr:hypothetical protein [Mycobacterium kansasii]
MLPGGSGIAEQQPCGAVAAAGTPAPADSAGRGAGKPAHATVAALAAGPAGAEQPGGAPGAAGAAGTTGAEPASAALPTGPT